MYEDKEVALDREIAELDHMANEKGYTSDNEQYQEQVDTILIAAEQQYSKEAADVLGEILQDGKFETGVEYARKFERWDIGGFDWTNPSFDERQEAEETYNEVTN